jgi:spore coat polysaccharide biosynthesis protein SpsF
MSKIGGIIFARMNSTRLPGKALKMIEGITLLGRVINASLKINNIDHLCIATSSSPEDDKIELFAKKVGVAVYRGSEDDVIDRAIKACSKFKYQSFARICGDRPFINSEIYDELLLSHNKCNADITTNIFPRCVPFGLSAEIINVKSLGSITSLLTNNSEKEHITKFFYNNYNNYKINKVNHKNVFVEHILTRLVVDNENDLKKTRWMIKNHKKQKIKVSTKSLIEMDYQWQLNYSTNNIHSK